MNLELLIKLCPQCKIEKSINNFGKCKTKQDGLRHECKQCRKDNYYKNREKILESKKIDYKKHRPERLLQEKIKYKQNPEFYKQKSSNYYNKNKSKVSETSKEYREKNKDYIANRKSEYWKNKQEEKKQKELEFLNSLITVNYPSEYKICSYCKTLKLINENFNIKRGKRYQDTISYRSFCLDCESLKNKNYRQENKEILLKKEKNQRIQNPEKHREKGKRHRQSESYKKRCQSPKYRIFRNLGQYIKSILSNYGLSKNGKSKMLYIDCEKDFFYFYIQLQFKPGMTWDNYGSDNNNWSLDHFIPKEAFNILDEKEQYICFNWRNCQPMWHIENESKQDKMPNGELARNTKQDYTLQDKIDLINKRLENFDISHLIDKKDKYFPNLV